jgi:hypothetical protein
MEVSGYVSKIIQDKDVVCHGFQVSFAFTRIRRDDNRGSVIINAIGQRKRSEPGKPSKE